jgi:hypothetical protein
VTRSAGRNEHKKGANCDEGRSGPGRGRGRTLAIVAALDQRAMLPANIARITVPVCSCAIEPSRDTTRPAAASCGKGPPHFRGK